MPARKLEWKRVKKEEQSSPLLITPLIDIMFLLLIFFVMNTSFNKLAPLDVSLPESNTVQNTEISRELTLLLYANEVVRINDKTIPYNELSSELPLIIKKEGTQRVIIAGDESISYAFLVKVMDEVRTTGLTDITLLTETE